jgi:hypothetical protein
MAAVSLNGALDTAAQSLPSDPLEEAKRRTASELNREDAVFLLIAEASTVKVMPDRAAFQGRPGEPVEISVAGGETEAGQIIVAPINARLKDVTFDVSDFEGPDGATLEGAVSVHVVGYVRTDPAFEPIYEVDRSGWFPDPILPAVSQFDVERDRVQSLWLSVRIDPGQIPGIYRGSVRVAPANAPPETIAVRVRVFDFTVPREPSYPVTVTVFDDRLKSLHRDRWSEDLYWTYVDFLREHRLDFDNSFRDHGPPPTVEQIERLVAGGQQGWGLGFIRQPGEGFSDVGVDASEFAAYLDQAIEDAKVALGVLEAAGARELAYIYLFDEVRERHFETLLTTARRIREELPGVPIWTSAQDQDFGATSGLDEVIDNWAVSIAAFDDPERLATIERARASGAEVTWYTAIWPFRPFPNFFIEYDAIEARLLMGAMAQKIGPDGFGFWSLNWWANQDAPLASNHLYTDWDVSGTPAGNGDGSWIMAGADGPITTIRFENIRDGLEDYEYYQLLSDAVDRGEESGVDPEVLDRARRLLRVPDDIVRGLTDFTRDPRVLELHRLEVAETIERLSGRGGQ